MKIIEQLENLTTEELREIKNRCDYLIIRRNNKDPNHHIWFYDFIKDKLFEKYQFKYPPYSVYKKSNEFKYFKGLSGRGILFRNRFGNISSHMASALTLYFL